MIDARIVNSVLSASHNTFTQVLQLEPLIGKPAAVKDIVPKYNIITILGFNGDIQGNFVYSFNEQTALKIVSRMMGMEYSVIDELSLSAIGELGNMSAGGIAMSLEKLGYTIDITPPTVVTGKDLRITAEGVVIRLPVKLFDEEDLEIHVAIRGNK